MSTAVRVKSRALSLDWNHSSHGPRLERVSAEARVRYTAVPTPPLTQGAGGEQPPDHADGPNILYSYSLPTTELHLSPLFAGKCKGEEMGECIENLN